MGLVVELTQDEEHLLAAAASREGMAPAEYLHRLLAQHLTAVPSGDHSDPTVALFARWDAEDAAMTPEETEAARRQHEQFVRGINEERERAGARRVYP